VGAVLTGRPDFRSWAGEWSEAAHWLLGPGASERFAALPEAPAAEPLRSLAFPDSGFYLLQSGHRAGHDRISVFFDCGALGFGSIAAHGHADALAFTLRAFGGDVLVDPGTYDYFTFPEWRSYFRATRAHNTVEVDGLDQSVMLGPFLWGQRAQARCLRFAPDADGGVVAGEHDGYARLPDPVVHRRTLRLDGRARTLVVEDELLAAGRHEVASRFHLAEACRVVGQARNLLTIEAPGGRVELELDPRLVVETQAGSESPIGGWVSRGYHRRAASVTIVGRAAIEGNATFVCHVRISPVTAATRARSSG
jgi:hypothetical protein